MKNTSGGQLVQGDLITFKAVAAGDEFTTTTTQGDDLVFGMVDATIADAATGAAAGDGVAGAGLGVREGRPRGDAHQGGHDADHQKA